MKTMKNVFPRYRGIDDAQKRRLMDRGADLRIFCKLAGKMSRAELLVALGRVHELLDIQSKVMDGLEVEDPIESNGV